MKAVGRRIRMSSKKANIVADLVRTKRVTDALNTLKFTNKRAADSLYKIVLSAKSNAEKNFEQDAEKLYIKEIIVNEGPTYKRWNPVSRGRAHPIRKRTCHITVTLSVEEVVAPKEQEEAPKAEKAAKKQEKDDKPKKKTTPKKEEVKKKDSNTNTKK